MEAINQILEEIQYKEKLAKRRAIAFTFIPLITAILLITYTSQKIIKAQNELNTIEQRMSKATLKINNSQSELYKAKLLNSELKKKNDSLNLSLTQSVITLGKAVSVTTEFKKFIDKMEPQLRSQGEASFYINFRMLEDKIRGDYETLSKTISELPKIDDNKVWIVIVESSASFEDLKRQSNSLISIYGKNQIAIYQNGKNNYALCVIGNGTFTRAYRLNVELRDKYGFDGAYFSDSTDWGTNYFTND